MNGQKPDSIEISRKSPWLHCQTRQTDNSLSLAMWIPQLPRQSWSPGWDGNHGAEAEAAYTQVCPHRAAELLSSCGHFHCFSRTDQWKCSSKLVLDHFWAHLAPHYCFVSRCDALQVMGHPSCGGDQVTELGSHQVPFQWCGLHSCSVPCRVLCSPGVGSWRFSHR